MPPISKSAGSQLVIAIDFGTTFSGVAWARNTRPDQINIVSGWASDLYTDCEDKQKTPSSIQYNSNGDPASWGYGCTPTDSRVKWFKILLIDDADQPEYLRQSRELLAVKKLLKNLNKEPVEVISDNLGLLWEHSLACIERATGKMLLETSSFHVVVTVPAIWPAYAQTRMREAVSLAGITCHREAGETTLQFVSEPEAAALATLADMSDRADVQAKDNFVVCDAGGGTVDLITYGVSKKKPLTISETVKGDGDLCGAILLDQGFKNLLRHTIPRSIIEKLQDRGMFRLINSHWENGLKAKFTRSTPDFEIPLPFGGTRQDGFHPPIVKIKSSKMLAIYQPIADQISALIQKQVKNLHDKSKQRPKFVVLVGGFGRNRFLYNHLRGELGEIEVLQGSGNQPWTAVCRGAVIKGLSQIGSKTAFNIAVQKRIARYSIGTLCNVLPWDGAEHDTRDRAWCDIQQDFLALDQTQWFVKNGGTVSTAKPYRLTFWQDLETSEDEITTKLFYSKAAEAPFRRDETVKRLCAITWAKVPRFDKLPVWENPEGVVYRHLCYEIRMVADSASLDFAVYHEGKRVASKNVDIEYEAPDTARVSTPPPRSEQIQEYGLPTPGGCSDNSTP